MPKTESKILRFGEVFFVIRWFLYFSSFYILPYYTKSVIIPIYLMNIVIVVANWRAQADVSFYFSLGGIHLRPITKRDRG